MTQPTGTTVPWVFGLNVYIPTKNDLEAVKNGGGFSPLDQALIDSGFWTADQCLAFRIFEQGARGAIENPVPFLEFYNNAKEQADAKEAGVILPEKSGIIIPR